MPVHIFVLDEANFEVCIRRGLAAVPNSLKNPNISDALISRMSMINKDDLILFYIIKKKELHGVYRALERPFFDPTQVWCEREDGQCYPFRIRIDNSDYTFKIPLKLSDIYDLRDKGIIWTFSLRRPAMTTTNAIFTISNSEYNQLLTLYLKLNPIYSLPRQIREPYPYFDPNLLDKLTVNKDYSPKYEYTLMALLLAAFAIWSFKDIFGNYSDFLSYVPTSFEKEIDILLIFNNPGARTETIAYNIIEVKRDSFDEAALNQLFQYEDWFLRKKVNGDYSMLRTTAIATSFSEGVKDYLVKREKYEGKRVKLLRYHNSAHGLLLTEEELI